MKTFQEYRTQLDEELKFSIHRAKNGWHVNQHTANGVWHHSTQTGYHKTKEEAINWTKKRAGDRKHSIVVEEK